MNKRNVVHIEIPAADSAKAAKFYEALFGWKTTRDEKMDYVLWEPTEGPGGGFSPLGEDTQPGDILIHISSDDIDADLKKVVNLGGSIIRQSTEIPGFGWFGVFKDPTGNMISLFKSKNPQPNN